MIGEEGGPDSNSPTTDLIKVVNSSDELLINGAWNQVTLSLSACFVPSQQLRGNLSLAINIRNEIHLNISYCMEMIL